MISLDGAKPDFIQKFIEEGVLPRDGGLARLSRQGAVAMQNVTASPSLTAVSHIEIATGSTAVHNDVPSNTFQSIVGPISSSLSGFAAPIGGYRESPLGPSQRPTASPLWVQLRQQGKKVVTATWPGGDGADISINNTVVQPAQPTRVTDYTIPFGAFGGIGAQGFSLSSGRLCARFGGRCGARRRPATSRSARCWRRRRRSRRSRAPRRRPRPAAMRRRSTSNMRSGWRRSTPPMTAR